MKDYKIQFYLKKLECDNRNELDSVLTLNPAYFSLEYLRELKFKWESQEEIINKYFSQLTSLILFSPTWVILGLMLTVFTEGFFLTKIIYLFPISLFIFIIGMIYLFIRYGGKNHQAEIGETIYTELEKRRQHHRRKWMM